MRSRPDLCIKATVTHKRESEKLMTDTAAATDNILDAYDAQPDIIHGHALDGPSYLVLARALWARSRHNEAEQTLEAAMKKFTAFGDAQDLYDLIRGDRSSLFQSKQTPLSHLRFYLDSLKSGMVMREAQLKNAEIRGWVEVSEQRSELLVQENDRPIRIEQLTRNRPDVITHLAARGASDRVLRCGFSFNADFSDRLRISLRSPSTTTPIVEVTKSRVMQVVEGRDGWLFLDNDTNKSVDIFTGRLPASPKDATNWGKFTSRVKARLDQIGIANCVVIAPSKEDVFPELHPRTPAHISILDVVVSAIFSAGVPISSPVRRLRQAPASYYPTDTHWSDLGAWICVRDILATLGMTLPESFQPAFSDVEAAGDLGAKTNPIRRSIRKQWAPEVSHAELVFDNRISGSGSIWVYKNPTPVIDRKVLVFGGSSSAHLTKIMADIFRETIRINCPATMPIMEVVQLCKPDIVLIQTNARYLRSCPRIAETITDTVLSKLNRSQMPPEWFAGMAEL